MIRTRLASTLLLSSALTPALAAQVDLHTVRVAPRGNVVVVYSKAFATCAHMLTPTRQLLHTNNIFCTLADFVGAVFPPSAFNALFAVGNQVMLCHGNNYNQCSPFVTVTAGPALTGNRTAVSLQAGGTQTFTLDAGSQHAAKPYLLLGTASGTNGFPFGAHTIPLTPDGYFMFTLSSPNTFPLANSLGVLDGSGGATAALTLPAGLPSALVGLVLQHAFVVLTPVGIADVSNPWPLVLLQ